MQSSRDSSIWRSLAVAFGDGVAFGVGVKLAQGPNRPPAGAPPVELPPAADRLEQLDRRLSAVEKAPAPAVSLAPSAPAPFDQKVLEAVVNALDARLHEQSGKVESRIAELEAKLAIELKNLERQDRSIVAGLQGRIDEVHGQYNEHVTAIRDAVAQDMDLLYGQIGQLRQEYAAGSGTALDERIAAAVTAHLETRIATLEVQLHDQVLSAVDRSSLQVASAAAGRVDEQLAAVHAALAEKDREIAELRQRIADSEQTALDLILAMGQMCRQVAERISGPEPAPVADPPREEDSRSDGGPSASPPAEPPTAEQPPDPPSAGPSAPPNGDNNGHSSIEPMPMASAQRLSHLWRIPLVSSFLILAAGSLSLLR
jgi:hypothetical protein